MRCKVGWFVAISLMVLCDSSSNPAKAQAAPDQASALIDRGVDLRVDKRDAEALALFEKANELSPSARALAQIGLAEQALGRWVAAEQHLMAALAATDDPWIMKSRAALLDGLELIRTHLGSVQIEANIVGAEVVVNGVVVATTPMREPARVPAATAVIVVRAPHYISAELRRNIEGGALVRENVSLAPEQPVPRVDSPSQQQHNKTPAADASRASFKSDSASPRTWAYVSGSVGLAGLAATGILATLAVNKTSDLPQACKDDPNRGCSPSQGDDINTARTYAGLANITLGVGVVGLGIGTWLLLQSPPTTENAGRVHMLPAAGLGYGGLDVGGKF